MRSEAATQRAERLGRERASYARRAESPEYLARKQEAGGRYRARHPERAAEQRRAAVSRWQKANQRDIRRHKRLGVLAFLGGACMKCGFDKPPALQVDHINGGGRRERMAGGGTIFEQWNMARSDPDGLRAKYQLLCANCHALKGTDV